MNIIDSFLRMLGFKRTIVGPERTEYTLTTEDGDFVATYEDDDEDETRLIIIDPYDDRLCLDQFLIQAEDCVIDNWQKEMKK